MKPATSPDNEDFVDIFFGRASATGGPHGHPEKPKDPKTFYEAGVKQASAPYSDVPVSSADLLRRLYPNHTLVSTSQTYQLNILGLPGVDAEPLEDTPLITDTLFIPIARRAGLPGLLVEDVQLGSFKLRWDKYEFILHVVSWPIGYGRLTEYHVLYEGPDEGPARLLLLTAGAWSQELHDEIWVFNQGFWQKDHGLWAAIQDSKWEDVILKDEFKKAIQKDVYGFFSSEKVYKDLSIPWKRGLILYGPPGNGKTISLKTIMRTCQEKGYNPLYVKSFQSWMGEEYSMAQVFGKARQLAPCVLILEDLDALINDSNRSFFLNQVDGLEGNDGLLLIGTTNHFDRLDPGLSTRPSRFDRKYEFDDPDFEERVLYTKYWQEKLAKNPNIEFPDSLVNEIAELTDRFSFAYLKEAFVSTLVTIAGAEEDKPSFAHYMKKEIATLRKQLDKGAISFNPLGSEKPRFVPPTRPPRPGSSTEKDLRAVLDSLSGSATARGKKIFDTQFRPEQHPRNPSDFSTFFGSLSDYVAPGNPQARHYQAGTSRNYSSQSPEHQRDVHLFNLQNEGFGSNRNYGFSRHGFGPNSNMGSDLA